MKNNNNVFWAAAFGAIVGGATVYYLNTKEGKKMTKNAKKKFQKMEKNARKSLKVQSENLSKKAKETMDATKDWVHDVTENAKHKIGDLSHKVADMVEDSQDDFDKGVEKAKNALHNKTKS